MTNFRVVDRFLCLAGRAPLLLLALLAACSSGDKRSLVLVVVPVSDYAGAQTVIVDVTVPGAGVTELTVDLNPGTAGTAAAGHYGVYLAAGISGNATVSVSVRDRWGCELARGDKADVPINPGETSGPVIIALAPSASSCSPDGGSGLDTLPPVDVGGATEAAGGDLTVGRDGGTLDAAGPDRAASPDDAGDARTADVALPTEVGGEVAPDLPSQNDLSVADAEEVGATTANVFRNCNSYTHTDSTGPTPAYQGVLQLIFTPDGKNLVSYGEDGRAKVWSVTATGLAELSSELVFTGSGGLYGGISPDGKYVAIADTEATVKIFDLPRSLSAGAAVSQWTLLPSTLPTIPSAADVVVFTKDPNHVVVGYYGGGAPDDNHIALWELGASPKIVQTVSLASSQRVWTGVPGSSPASAWIGILGGIDTDAGYQNVVAVLEISPTGVVRVETAASGFLTDMAFSSNGNILAAGHDNGQVLLYDFADKSKLVLQSPPLIAETASAYARVYGMAFTPDDKYFAAGLHNLNTGSASVRLLPVATRQSTEKALKYVPYAVAFAPSGLGLAVGEAEDGTMIYCTP